MLTNFDLKTNTLIDFDLKKKQNFEEKIDTFVKKVKENCPTHHSDQYSEFPCSFLRLIAELFLNSIDHSPVLV